MSKKLIGVTILLIFLLVVFSYFWTANAGNPPEMWEKAYNGRAMIIWVSAGDSTAMLEGTADGALLMVMQGNAKKTLVDSVTIDGTETETMNFTLDENAGIYGIFALIDSLDGTLGALTVTVTNYYFGVASSNAMAIGNMTAATITDGKLLSDQIYIEPGGDSLKVSVSGNGTGDSWECKIGLAYY